MSRSAFYESLDARLGEHAALLNSLSRFENVASQLREANASITSLEKAINERQTKLGELMKKRVADQKDLDALQSSPVKQLLLRVKTGKIGLLKRLEKEGMDYSESALAEYEETQALMLMQSALTRRNEEKAVLEQQAAERDDLKKRLEDLYDTVFSGPTPEFPEEDSAEDAVNDAENRLSVALIELNTQDRALDLLQKAFAASEFAYKSIQSARKANTWDVNVRWVDNIAYAEPAQRTFVIRSHEAAVESTALIQEARDLGVHIDYVKRPRIVSPEWIDDVVDSKPSEFFTRQELTRAFNALRLYCDDVAHQRKLCQDRQSILRHAVHEAEEYIESTRRELTAVRQDIMLHLQEERREAPPMYHDDTAPPRRILVKALPKHLRVMCIEGLSVRIAHFPFMLFIGFDHWFLGYRLHFFHNISAFSPCITAYYSLFCLMCMNNLFSHSSLVVL